MNQGDQGEMQSMEKMFAKMMSQMESVHAQFRSDLLALNSKVESIILKENFESLSHTNDAPKKLHRGNRVSFGGGDEAQISSDQNESGSKQE
jgi:hypothetical protein